MAKPKNKQSTTWPGMRGRDAARELILKVDNLQVNTIDFSEIQFVVNHISQSDRQNESAKSGMFLHKKTIHIVSNQRRRKDTKDNGILLWTKQAKMGLWKFDLIFELVVSMKNRLHHESCEQVEEIIHLDQCNRWHPLSSTSLWDKSQWNWKGVHNFFKKKWTRFFLLQLVSFTVDSDRL